MVGSSEVANIGRYEPFCYIKMSPGDRCSVEPSLVGKDSSDGASESGSEVGSSIMFSLGGPGSEVGSVEGGSLMD